MMQLIRERAQGVVAWIIVAMIIVVFLFWGVTGYFDRSTPVLAIVNGKDITALSVDEMYNRWLRYVSTQKEFDMSAINPAQIKQQILRSLVEQEAMISSLRRDGFAVSDAMLISSIRNNPNLKQDNKFSIEKYQTFLQQLNLDEETFEQAHRDELLVNQLQMGIITSGFVLKNEAERVIAIRNQKRDFGYTVISAAPLQAKAEISSNEIDAFYNQHKANFVTPEKIKLQYVELSLDDLMQDVRPTNQQLEEYYKENIQSFSTAPLLHLRHIMIAVPESADANAQTENKAKIDAVYSQLNSGVDFVVLAKGSDDQLTAEKGGDLGWISSNDSYPPEVYSLKNKGDFTKPVRSDYGWHVFQLVETKGGGVKDFASVKNVVTERYKREQAEKAFAKKGEELANLAFENPRSLNEVSAKLDLPLKTTDYFTREGGSGLSDSPAILRAAFSDAVFEQQNNSDLIRVSDDSYVIIRIIDKQAQRQLDLAEVRDDIVKNLKMLQARTKAKELGEKVLSAIKDSADPAKVASSNRLEWHKERNVDRDDKSVDRQIRQQAFVMSKPIDSKFTTNGFSLPNGDYVVIALSNVTEGKMVDDAEDSSLLEMVGKQMAGMEGRLEFMSFQAALIDQAKIKYKKS